MPASHIPEGYHSITPYVLTRGADALIGFLARVFDATEKSRLVGAKGEIKNAEIRIGDSMIYLADAPDPSRAMPASLYLYVKDVDATYARALEAGAKTIFPPSDRYYGDRLCGVQDPFGNTWWIATHVEDLSAEEIQRRADAAK